MNAKWYATNAGNDSQGIVTDEKTGRSVAVVYDRKDTPLLAAAPELLAALKMMVDTFNPDNQCIYDFGRVKIHLARAAIAKATQ